MKHKPDFVLQQVADTHVVVPVGEQALAFNGILTLNGTGAFLWQQLDEDVDIPALIQALRAAYEVDEQTALADVAAFITALSENNLLTD
ncbi:MAG: PqqD family protein [Clostridiales bacterium]|nr:PqqD family protein [Clostridiales bacterium]